MYGATIVPILANFSPEDTQHIINHSDVELLFISRDKYDSLDCENCVRFATCFLWMISACCTVLVSRQKLSIKSFAESEDLKSLPKSGIVAKTNATMKKLPR